VLARYQGTRLIEWVEQKLEGWLGLVINRNKTRVVDLNQEGGCLTFLGYQFQYEADQFGRGHRYLRLEPSLKALAKEREALRQMTGPVMCFKPIPVLIGEINRHLRGWKEYFGLGHARRALRKIDGYVRQRLIRHLRRRSQRPFRPPEGTTWYAQLTRLGLLRL
jgi:RNA-directed DNA polymerase